MVEADIMVGANGAFVGNENGHGQAYIYYGSGSRWKSVFAQNFNASRGMQIGSLTLDQYNLINNSFFGISTPNWEIDRTGNASFQSLISAGNVGIGTSTPYTKLDVYGSFQVGTSTTPTLTPLFIANTGTATVGIGTSTPSAKFAIAGVAGVNSLNIASTTGVSMLSLDQYGNLGVGKASASRRV
ncbi:MAG: hypothetical protein NTZ42_01670, partial [Candidatus Gribaldobacteria bacterium]|nr:hypothetical protein [Candidatus Gribaldobacteria bacterium]